MTVLAQDRALELAREKDSEPKPASLKTVSVIIPFSKPATVGNAIESVLAQDYPAELVQIIVVGKGSQALRETWPQIQAIDVGPIREPGRARNLGAAEASGEVLLFLDDDCEAQEGWIRENLAELENPQVGAVSGMIEGKSKALFARVVDYANFGLCQTKRRTGARLWTATFGIRRALFENLGGFDGTLGVHEDIDMCFRLLRAGYLAVHQPRVKVLHNHGRTSLRALLEYQYSHGMLGGLAVENKYPEASLRNRMLARFQDPLLYAVAAVPFSLAGTLSAVWLNAKEHPEVLPLAPFIFLGKLACHCGICRCLIKDHFKHSWQLSGTMVTTRRLIQYSLLRGSFKTPRELILFITSQCNARCGHCFYWRNLHRKNDLSFEEIDVLSRSLGKLDKLLISGGEPFLRKDLPEICELFVRNNDVEVISIPSNGLCTELIVKQARRILDRADGRIVNIAISLDGLRSQHDAIRGVPGAFERAVSTHRSVHELEKEYGNLRTSVVSVIMDRNCDDLFRLVAEVPSLMPGVNVPCFALLRGSPFDTRLALPDIPKMRALHRHKMRSWPGDQPLIWKVADWATFTLTMEVLLRRRQPIPCEAGRMCGVVDDNGDVRHCEMLPPIGSIRETGFYQIWNSPRALEERKKIEEGRCYCTHECHLFPSLLAHPLRGLFTLVRAFLQGA